MLIAQRSLYDSNPTSATLLQMRPICTPAARSISFTIQILSHQFSDEHCALTHAIAVGGAERHGAFSPTLRLYMQDSNHDSSMGISVVSMLFGRGDANREWLRSND